MKNYYLYLNPNTFMWKDKESVLLYNALQFSCELFERGEVLDRITDQLSETDNLYCIELTSAEMEDKTLQHFISMVDRAGFGGLLEKAHCPNGKPVFLKPILSLQESYEHKKKYEENYWEDNYLQNLIGINLYLDGNPKSGDIYKQYPYPHSLDKQLAVNDVLKMLEKVRHSSCNSIGIISDFREEIPGFVDLMNSLDQINATKTFYCTPESFENGSFLLSAIGKGQFQAVVYLDKDTEEEIAIALHNKLTPVSSSLEFRFLLEGKHGLEKHNRLKQLLAGFEFRTLPLFNGKNAAFFEENVFLTKEDIMQTQLNKRQVFAQQAMNVKDFGRLSVFPDGKVYANVNNPPLGTIRDELLMMIKREFEEGNSWLKTREKVSPCNDCLFCHLCPPISNYEYVMDRFNLCHVKEQKSIISESLV